MINQKTTQNIYATPVIIEMGFSPLEVAVDSNNQIYVTAINASSFFQSGQNQPNKWLERIGIAPSSLDKLRITGYKNNQLALKLSAFSKLALLLAKKDNKVAEEYLEAALAETIETRVRSKLELEPFPLEIKQILYHYRCPNVTIKERKSRQKMVQLVYRRHEKRINLPQNRQDKPYRNIGKEMTTKINLAVYGQKHFKCNRTDNMTLESQAAIAEIERYIVTLDAAEEYPCIEQIVNTAIERHKISFGNQYFLEENKKKVTT
jgi:hypothetical protein